jgi:hypothetical protein
VKIQVTIDTDTNQVFIKDIKEEPTNTFIHSSTFSNKIEPLEYRAFLKRPADICYNPQVDIFQLPFETFKHMEEKGAIK